jgi:HD domain
MRLADRLGVDRQTAVQTYYGSLLSHAGCTTDAHLAAEVFGGSLTKHLNPLMYGSSREVMTGLIRALPDPGASGPTRAVQIALRLPRMVRSFRPAIAANCEVAGMLAEQTGAPAAVAASLAYLTDRWDGKGPLRRAAADAIPLSMRIVHVAIDAALQRRLAGEKFAARLIGEHAGRGLDPEVAGRAAADAPELLSFTDGSSVWEEALAAEPRPWSTLAGEEIDRALAAIGRFADLICPYHSGHSIGVAELAAAAAARCGMDAAGTRTVRRAGLVHDLGRVAVSAATWGKPGPLSADEWEQVRLHPYRTERVLSRVPGRPRAGRVRSPRVSRPVRLPPRHACRGVDHAGPAARGGGHVPHEVRTAPAPRGHVGRAGCASPRRRGEGRSSRSGRRCRRGRVGRPAGATPRSP